LKKETIVIADSDDEPFIPVAKKKPAPKDNGALLLISFHSRV